MPLALHAFLLGVAIGALLMAAAYIFVNPFSIDMLGARIAFAFGILAAACICKHRRVEHIRKLTAKQRTLG